MRGRVILTLSAAICLLLVAAGPAAPAQGVQVRFDLTDPQGGPFPTDRFTVPDPTQLTGLRVNLPPEPDCSVQSSDCNDLDVLNTLDGFNLQPRLSIPFTGPIDLATVSSDTVFLFKLGCLVSSCPGGSRVGINQVVWDPATNTLAAESDQLLDQDGRYLLVVTKGIHDASGDPIGSTPFRKFLNFGQTMDAAAKAYRADLLQALDQLETAGVSTGDVAAASLFTTESATAVMEKIRDQLAQATPDPANFVLGSNGERTVLPAADVQKIAFKRQTGTAPTFSTSFLPLSQLQVVPGSVGTIAFGKYRSPDYETEDGVIPPVGTGGGTPAVRETNDVYFNLFLPASPQPAGGWPVVIAGHGLQGQKNVAGLSVAAKLAEHGLAMIVIDAVGHGGGPLGTLTVTKTDAGTITLPAGGRGVDQNEDGTIDRDEGFFTAPSGPQAIVLARDGVRQTVVDLMQLVRELQVGIDVDGDSAPDLDAYGIYYWGGSLGGVIGTDFVALEPSVRAGAFSSAGGSLVDIGRLSIPFRPLLGQLLGLHVPSLLNGGPDPINFPGNPFPNPSPFRDNLPLRDQPAPLVNDVPGAVPIQEEVERIEWAGESGDPVAYAPHLRKDPLQGNAAKPVLYSFAKGDWTIPNPTTSAILRAGGLADRATLFRFDLAYAQNPAIGTNPHGFLGNLTPGGIGPALQGQEQIATFLASDGQTTIDPDGPGALFETPIAGPLPEGICYIPFQLPCS